MSDEIGIGLVGYGAIGRLHALCYRMLPLAYPELPPVRIVGVVTASPETAERARRELGSSLLATTNLAELLAHPAVTAIDCCAPTGDHATIASAVLRAGKPLFCEKPLGATYDESQQLCLLALQHGLPGAVNYHMRFAPAIQEARRQIEAGLLGDVRGFHLRYYRSSNLRADRPLSWRFAGSGSGVLADLGSHMIDLALYLLGPTAAVAAHLMTVVRERPARDGRLAPVEADDAAWLTLELAGGGRGTIAVSKVVPGAGDDIRVEAHGSRGALIFDTRDPNGLEISDAGGSRRLAALSRTSPPATLPSAELPGGTLQWHLASHAAFVRAVAAGTPAPHPLEQAALVDQVIAAARRSAARGGAPEPL